MTKPVDRNKLVAIVAKQTRKEQAHAEAAYSTGLNHDDTTESIVESPASRVQSQNTGVRNSGSRLLTLVYILSTLSASTSLCCCDALHPAL